ncbi:MAG: iron-containing alcohol dehydrogenase [Candidatus Kapabacteria bacterium]|nr:iron-containing alcohol dehydrogenase [Ignavibacteriota bacterium]MCW5886134.1 iron-containing alcohol dehydrogenase [Candidatus Kapabacteria bacterium]
MFKNFKLVDKVVFGRGSFNQLDDILKPHRTQNSQGMVFLVDNFFINDTAFLNRLPLQVSDRIIFADVTNEPTTFYVDELTDSIKNFSDKLPDGIIGIGGGSTMDLAKAVSLMLTNPGSAADYQGWDLIKVPAIYHVGIPTLSGTGAEVSRTTVLTGPVKKLGINSDFTVFNQMVLDPELIENAPEQQRFYTAMDCYIHNAESLTGTYLNEFSRSFGEKSMQLCREVFLGDADRKIKDDKLMMASLFGGLSIAYSQVGVCHALSYGLSYILKLRHGMSNAVVFNQLDEYYPEHVSEFREIMEKNNIELPQNLTKDCTEDEFEKMADISLVLEPLWENALGKSWKEIISREKIKDLLRKM